MDFEKKIKNVERKRKKIKRISKRKNPMNKHQMISQKMEPPSLAKAFEHYYFGDGNGGEDRKVKSVVRLHQAVGKKKGKI